MTIQADKIRDRRMAAAAPGGPLDRLVRLLAIGLPALVGVIAALMLITPLSPRSEVSFLLDRNKVEVADERMRVTSAMYRGQDNLGRPFSLQAGHAVQTKATVPIVEMEDLTARILLSDGPAVLSAPNGEYDIETEQVSVPGLVEFTAADGYSIAARNVLIDLPKRVLLSRGRVEGAIPAGTFSADSIRADLEARTLLLEGNAHLSMTPGELQIPNSIP